MWCECLFYASKYGIHTSSNGNTFRRSFEKIQPQHVFVFNLLPLVLPLGKPSIGEKCREISFRLHCKSPYFSLTHCLHSKPKFYAPLTYHISLEHHVWLELIGCVVQICHIFVTQLTIFKTTKSGCCLPLTILLFLA